MPTTEDRMLILDRLSKGDATTRQIQGREAGIRHADGSITILGEPWPIPGLRLSVGYGAALKLLHAMERDGLIKHYTLGPLGNTLHWKITSTGERQLASRHRAATDRTD